MRKEIWLPKSELNVRVEGHEVHIYEHMTMNLEPITTKTGFSQAIEVSPDPDLYAYHPAL